MLIGILVLITIKSTESQIYARLATRSLLDVVYATVSSILIKILEYVVLKDRRILALLRMIGHRATHWSMLSDFAINGWSHVFGIGLNYTSLSFDLLSCWNLIRVLWIILFKAFLPNGKSRLNSIVLNFDFFHLIFLLTKFLNFN